MEPRTQRHRPATGPRSPGRPRVGGRAAIARTITAVVAVAGLAAGCVAPTAGGPGGPPSDGVGGSAGSATASPSTQPTIPPSIPPSVPPSQLAGGASSTPPGLAGRSWVTRGPDGSPVAGVTGSERRLAIPAGESPIEAARGLVATATYRDDGTGSTLRVRDIVSGRLVVEVSRPENVGSAVFVGDRVLATGHDPAGTGVDPGLTAISLVDGLATPLIEPGPVPRGWTGNAARSVVASSSGRTVVSALCLVDRCAVDVIDPTDGATSRVIDEVEAFPRALTDEVVILGSDDLARLAAYDLATGRRLWERTDAEFQYGYMTSDGRYVLSYIGHGDPWRFVASVVDPLTGEEQVVLEGDPNDGLRLWPALSGDTLAVLGTGGRFEDLSQGSRVVRASVLDLATGRLMTGGVTIVVAP